MPCPARTFAIYNGSDFERYVTADSATQAMDFARTAYGRDASARTNGVAFAPGSGVVPDKHGYDWRSAPHVAFLDAYRQNRKENQ